MVPIVAMLAGQLSVYGWVTSRIEKLRARTHRNWSFSRSNASRRSAKVPKLVVHGPCPELSNRQALSNNLPKLSHLLSAPSHLLSSYRPTMPRLAAPPAAINPRKAAQAQQDLAMAGLGDFDLPRTTVTRLARSQVSSHVTSMLAQGMRQLMQVWSWTFGSSIRLCLNGRLEIRQSCHRMSSRR